MPIALILIIIAAIFAVLALIGVPSRINLNAVGLLLVCVALLIGGVSLR